MRFAAIIGFLTALLVFLRQTGLIEMWKEPEWHNMDSIHYSALNTNISGYDKNADKSSFQIDEALLIQTAAALMGYDRYL